MKGFGFGLIVGALATLIYMNREKIVDCLDEQINSPIPNRPGVEDYHYFSEEYSK